MSFGTESSTPVGGQTLTGFIVSKAMQSRKEAKKSDRKKRRKKEDETSIGGEEKRQGMRSKLLGGLASLPNLFASKKPPVETPTKKQRSSGGATGLAKILSIGFGSLTTDNLRLSSSLAAITQLLNNSYKAQSFTATGVQSISAILSDQLENQSSILSTVKSLKPGGGSGGGGKSMFGTAKSAGVGGETLTGYLANKFDLGGKISQLFGKGVAGVKNLFNGGKPKVTASGGRSVPRAKPTTQFTKPIGPQPINSASPWAKGAAGEAANVAGYVPRLPSAPIVKPPGPMAKFGNMFNSAKGAVGGAVKGIQNKVGAVVAEKVGAKLASKGALAGARALPIAQQVLGIGLATKEIMDGDYAGAALALGSALPGPFGWGFLAADLGRELVGPELVDKSFGQAIGGNLGFSDQQIADREKNMSATQRAMTTFTPSFSSGGITTSMASGGIGRVMVGEAAGGSKGEAVVPLSSGIGKQMLGGGNSSGDPGMQTSAGSTLAVVDQFIKGMGPLGAPVAQALGPDIQQLSKTFGMSQTLPNLRIGGGKFKEDGNAKKSRDKFLGDLISGSLEALDAKKKDKPAAPPSPTPPPPEPPNPNGPTGQSRVPGPGADPAKPAGGTPANRSGKPMDGSYTAPTRTANGLKPVQGGMEPGRDQIHLEIPGFSDRFVLFNRKDGRIQIFKKGIFKGGNAGLKDMEEEDISYEKDDRGVYTDARMRSAFNQVRANLINTKDNDIRQRGINWGYITEEDIRKRNIIKSSGQSRGGRYNSVMPQTAPSMAPVGATNIANSQTNSVSIINIMGGSSGGGGSIPVSSSSSQDSSQYVSDPYPKGLAGVLCMSPWSVV